MSKSTQPIPPGHEHLIPHLVCDPCAKAIDFYKKAFGAEEISRAPAPDGQRIMHAAIRIGKSLVFLVDDFPEFCGGKSQSPRALNGTPVTIHLKGVGWTEYDNIYIATYDNGYMGYACGFNSRGDVVINFTAAGAPGVHLIDLYPGIYQGPEGSQQLYRLPQLTYADDHPGNRIPALRFAFTVTSR